MSSGGPPPDAASTSMPRYFYAGLCECFKFLTCLSINQMEETRNARRNRITYSREFLLSVAGSEACKKKLPAGIDASLLKCEMKWRSKAASASAGAERWGAAGSRDRQEDSPRFLRKKEEHYSPERARETEPFQTGVGSKWKPCPRFFSTDGCPFGEGCHFLHYFPADGHWAVAKMANPGGYAHPPAERIPPVVKTRLCNQYNTAEGCKWGDKCHFAHGERELSKHMMFFMDNSMSPPKAMATQASFGAGSATTKISVDASFVGAIIGRGGVSIKEISRVTGAKLAIRDHESDTSLKNIELEGTFDQIKNASTIVTELLDNIGSNFKTRLCENFTKGSCTFGHRCRFAHGENELRKSAAACMWQKRKEEEKSAAHQLPALSMRSTDGWRSPECRYSYGRIEVERENGGSNGLAGVPTTPTTPELPQGTSVTITRSEEGWTLVNKHGRGKHPKKIVL